MAGWIKISTDIAKHWIWNDAERLKWWIDILFMASWKDKKVIEDTHLITIKKGQFIASVAFLCKRWGKSNKTIIKYLKLLEEDEMIFREVLHRQTPIITICNYDKYQCNDDNSVHTIVHRQRQNEENSAYDIHTQNQSINESKSDSLGCVNDNDVQTMVHRQNDENSAYDIHTQNQSINESKSDSLGCVNDNDVQTIVHRKVHTIVHTSKEYNNIIVDDDVNTARAHEDKNAEFIEELKQSEIWLEQMQMRFKLNADEIKDKLDVFSLDCRCRGTEHKNLNDTRRHFNDWLRIQIESQNRNSNETTRRKPENKRRGSDVTASKAEEYDGAF